MKTVTCKRCGLPTARNKKNYIHPTLDECVGAMSLALSKLHEQMQQVKRSTALNAQAASAALYVANLSR